jgi:thiol-disulfide isomerase/thioredoxin
MRSTLIIILACGILSLNSCSEPQEETAVTESANDVVQPSDSQQRPQTTQSDHGDLEESDAVPEKSDDHASHGHASHGHGGTRSGHSEHGHAADDRSTDANTKKVAIGERVPDFEMTIDGKTWKLSELQKNKALTEDGTLVLTFWCSFCHSCRHVEDRLDTLAKQYKQKVGVIALDASAGETTEGVAEFAAKKGLTVPIALDASGTSADIFGTRVTTTTVIIDKNGVLQYRGQFADRQHPFAEDALRAVLAGKDVAQQETRQKG